MNRLFSAEATNTSSGAMRAHRERHTVFAWGTWGGATAKIQFSPDGVQWFDGASLSFTANGYATFEVARDTRIRGNIAGGTGASLNVVVV